MENGQIHLLLVRLDTTTALSSPIFSLEGGGGGGGWRLAVLPPILPQNRGQEYSIFFEEMGIGLYVAFNSLVHIAARDGNPEPGRNSLLFTNSPKWSFRYRSTLDNTPQRRTFIKLKKTTG